MHDPYPFRDRRADLAPPRPRIRSIQRWTTLGLILALLIVPLALLGLCWGVADYLVSLVYNGMDGPHMIHHLFGTSRHIFGIRITTRF